MSVCYLYVTTECLCLPDRLKGAIAVICLTFAEQWVVFNKKVFVDHVVPLSYTSLTLLHGLQGILAF